MEVVRGNSRRVNADLFTRSATELASRAYLLVKSGSWVVVDEVAMQVGTSGRSFFFALCIIKLIFFNHLEAYFSLPPPHHWYMPLTSYLTT